MRNAEWWLQAYYFLKQFKGYRLVSGTFLDGTYTRQCLAFDGQWCGPEVEISNVTKKSRFDGRRLLEISE